MKMWREQLRKGLLLETSTDPMKISQVRSFLRAILLFAGIVTILATVGLMLASIGGEMPIITLVMNVSLVIVLGFIYWLMHKGFLHSASASLIIAAWIYTSLGMYFSGGISNPVSGLLVILIFIAGTLLGITGIIFSFVLIAISSLVLSLIEANGNLPPSVFTYTPIQVWIVYTSVALTGGVIMFMWYQNIQNALAAAQKELTERKKAEHEANRRIKELEALNSVSQVLGSSQDAKFLMDAVLQRIQNVFDVPILYIALLDPQTNRLHFSYMLNNQAQPWAPMAYGEGMTTRVMQYGKPVLINANWAQTAMEYNFIDGQPDIEIKASLSVPMIIGGRTIGVISLQESRYENAFDQDAVRLLVTIASNVAIALENARLFTLAQHELEERKQAEAALRESEMRYRQAIIAADAVPYSLDYQTMKYDFIGDEILGMTGYTAAEMTPEVFDSLIIDSVMLGDLSGIETHQAVEKIRNGDANLAEKIWRCDYQIVDRQGNIRWLSDAAVQVLDINGKPIGSIGILQEITHRKEIEAELRKNEERYRIISSVISDYSFGTVIDENGDLHSDWAVGAFEKISGYDYEEFKATGGWRAHLHPDDIAQDDRDMEMLRKNQKTVSELRIIRKDGSICWVRSYAHPIWDEKNNRLRGIYGAVQDITQQKLAQEREEYRQKKLEKVIELGKAITQIKTLRDCLRAIHQSVQKGLEFDRVGLFLYNPQTDTIQGAFGTSREGEIEDTSWFSQPAQAYEAWQVALTNQRGTTIVDDYQNKHQHSSESEMYGVRQHVTLAAWAGEKPVGLIAVDNVISNRTITPEDVEALQLFAGYAGLAIENARLNDELENRVQQRTAELQETINELESFSYTVSHDLRAPLRAIHGFARILEMEYQEILPPEATDYVQKIRNNAKAMGQLVDDLLSFANLWRHPIRRVAVDMTSFFKQALDELKNQERSPGLKIIIPKLPPANADPSLVRQVLVNLLSNAIKYTCMRENAIIEVGTIEHQGKTAYFVRDNGIGFDMKYAHKLFGVFQRLQTDYEGTGVGLAIVQRIIEKHGGSIWTESEPENGATFYFTLE